MSPFRLALLNLTRRRIPSAIALICIAISVTCSGILLRLYILSGSRFSTLAKAGDAIVGAKAGGLEILLGSLNLEGGYPDFIPLTLYDSLKQKKGTQFEDGTRAIPTFVKGVIPFVYCGKYKNYRVIGTDEGFLKRPEPADNPTLSQGRWADGVGKLVLGSQVAAFENLKIGDKMTLEGWTSNEKSPPRYLQFNADIVGILAPTDSAWDQALFTSLEQAQKVFESVDLKSQSIWNANVLHYFLISLEPGGLEPLQALINRRTVAQVISVPEQVRRLEELTGTGRHLGFLMTVLIMFLGGLGVTAMMVTRFEAMNVQLAVLRALGYEKREIALWLLWEGLMLGVSACLIGAVFDAVCFPWIRNILGAALPSFPLHGNSVLLSAPVWGVAILATVIAVVIPLIRLYGQDIHSSLKGL